MATVLPDDSHFCHILQAIQKGHLVPFFGAGVNLANRPPNEKWQPDRRFLPSGAELSQHLASSYGYPEQDNWNLLRVSQYVAVESGSAALYEDLRKVFDADFPPTLVHDFFARLPTLLRQRGGGKSNLLIVTTNYDDLMEQSLKAAGEPYDVVTYVADGPDSGKFRHCPAGGPPVLITRPNEYRNVSPDKRHVVLKIHGAVDRADRRQRQLRHHRGPLHRLPDPYRPGQSDPRLAARSWRTRTSCSWATACRTGTCGRSCIASRALSH